MADVLDITVQVRAPATSANLGPGFDSLGLAWTVADCVTVTTVASGVVVEVSGEGAGELPDDETHLVVRGLAGACAEVGAPLPGLQLHCRNAIPQGRGLGSSAAAIVSGVLAGRALLEHGDQLLDDAAVLSLSARLEGHADNVAACLLGGLTVAWATESGVRAVSQDVNLRAVLFVPPQVMSTAEARDLLPELVPHRDAVRTVGRAALLVATLSSSVPSRDVLLAATQDWLHQPYRALAMPESFALVAELRASRVPAVLSGSGPSVLAFLIGADDPAERVRRYTPVGWGGHEVRVDQKGARVRNLAAGLAAGMDGAR